jgi:hypothetical protein
LRAIRQVPADEIAPIVRVADALEGAIRELHRPNLVKQRLAILGA